MAAVPDLYIKPGCPWCVEARRWLDAKGVGYTVRDVIASSENNRQMVALSGQKLTPTLVLGDFVVADFSVDELIVALNKAPAVCEAMGLKAPVSR